MLKPVRPRRFAEQDLARTSTDAIDALGIARFAAQKRTRATPVPDAAGTELGDIAKFGTTEALATDVGVVPARRHPGNRTSGRAGLTPFGYAALRAELSTPTLRAVRSSAWLKAFDDGLRARGKLPRVARIAAMRKRLAAALSVARHRRSFVPQLVAPGGTP